jgi:hypothetical protein
MPLEVREKRDSRVPSRLEQPSPADVLVIRAIDNNARRMIGVSSHSQAQDASRHCLFAQTALIESALL